MCYLPKATFYLYFGFFFLGYLWIFGIFFYNAWTDQTKVDKSRLELKKYERDHGKQIQSQEKKLDNNIGKKLGLENNKNMENIAQNGPQMPQNTHGEGSFHINVLDFNKPLPEYLLSAATKDRNMGGGTDASNAPCVQLRSVPPFALCVHSPKQDKGMSAQIATQKDWEPELSGEFHKFLETAGPSKTLVMDIGANLGYYSILASKMGFSVLAIEPFADSIARFHSSAIMNKVSQRITVIQAAVSDKSGTVKMVGDAENFGNRFVVNSKDKEYQYRGRTPVTVPAIVLDDFVPILKKTYPKATDIILKIGIQGHECFAMKGGERLLSEYDVNPIIMEWELTRRLVSEHDPGSIGCVKGVLSLMNKHGYKPYTPQGNLINNKLDDRHDTTLPNDIIWKKTP